MRNSVDVRPTSKPSWRKWRKANKKKYNHITFLQYKEILQTYNRLLLQKALETGEKIKTPIGEFYYEKYKLKVTVKDGKVHRKKLMDFAKSRELGKRVLKTNVETDGWFARLKFKPKIQFSKLWKFTQARYAERHSKKLWKEGGKIMENYLEKI